MTTTMPAPAAPTLGGDLDPAGLLGRRVTVMGLGNFGGGLGVSRWLAARGARVTITDKEPANKLGPSIAALRALVSDAADLAPGRVRLVLGEHRAEDFASAEVVVANPAVKAPWTNEYLATARHAGAVVTTEMGLVVRLLRRAGLEARTVGITGSAGKSTTTAMIAHALRALRVPVLMGGNIGGSLLDALTSERPAPPAQGPDLRPIVVLELSSFMLHWLGDAGEALRFAPGVAVVTNIATNHTDWHGDMDHYTRSKMQLLAHQPRDAAKILGPGLDSWAGLGLARVIPTAELGLPLRLPGEHNRHNAAQAAAAVGMMMPDRPGAEIHRAIAEFPGLVHRLQFAGSPRGVRCFNDSKSTTPESTLMALAALAALTGGPGRVRVILGGYDKGSDMRELVGRCAALGVEVFSIGATGPSIAALARAAGVPVTECATVEAALPAALRGANPGDVVLLSPACASWDQFTNYEARGDLFCRLVKSEEERA
ncbi:MAG: Mur ligase family protein [Phycisphaerales bacterium]